MNIIELTTPIFQFIVDNTNLFDSNHDNIKSSLLHLIEKQLNECDEFKNVTKLVILDTPFTTNKDGDVIEAHSIKLNDNLKFSGKLYLYAIIRTPEMYNINTMYTPVKDGCCITPTIYNPETFVPVKHIMLAFSPEQLQDSGMTKDNSTRKQLHNMLDTILDNQNEYQVRGEHGIILRCIAETIEQDGKIIHRQNMDGITLDSTPFQPIYYIENSGEYSSTTMPIRRVQHKYIPSELTDKFIEEFGDKGIDVTGAEIEAFLAQNINK